MAESRTLDRNGTHIPRFLLPDDFDQLKRAGNFLAIKLNHNVVQIYRSPAELTLPERDDLSGAR